MAKGMPSMLALLGLLAVAGYQNRDKISEALGGLQKPGAPGQGAQGGLDGMLSGLGDALGGDGKSGGLGGILSGLGAGGLAGGLGDLLESFKGSGQSEVANSWIDTTVATQGLRPDQVEKAIGAENLDELVRRTGLTREDLLQRLSKSIPETIDRVTPNGEMPTEDQLRQRLVNTA
jgi:uncharacterized protein YidB (DUF937 family)